MTRFTSHHTAISVADIEASKAFYGYFGFEPVVQWSDEDKSLTIAHLRLDDGHLLELFCYAESGGAERPACTVGNDLPVIGVKHLAVQVADLAAARAEIVAAGIGEVTEIARGRTLVDYFFVRDPDGMYVEVVHDSRVLDSSRPLLLPGGAVS